MVTFFTPCAYSALINDQNLATALVTLTQVLL